MKRAIVIAAILLLVGGLGYATYRLAHRPLASQDLETVTVRRGDIMATVSATGSVAPARQVALAFRSGGELAQLLVEEGQGVEGGALLARLETGELEEGIAQAQASLVVAEARLAQTEKGAAPEDIAAARASLESAQANLERLKEGPSQEEITIARADLERARIALEQAQSAYDQIAWLPSIGMTPQAAALEQAGIDYERAKAAYELAIAKPSESEIKSAEAQLVQAQAQLEKLLQSPTSEELAIAQGEVDRARASLRQLELQLEGATIVAPFSGVVASVGAEEGELVAAATPVIRLLDPSHYHVDLEIDEVDIATIRLGHEVIVELDALPERELRGMVDYIAPAAHTLEGVVTYLVRVAMEPNDAPLRAGMTANATIITEKKEGVLLVPNRAIQFDRESGRIYVEKVVEGKPVPVEIEIGLQDEAQSEVTRGLEEGDLVAIRSLSTRERLQMSIEASHGGQ